MQILGYLRQIPPHLSRSEFKKGNLIPRRSKGSVKCSSAHCPLLSGWRTAALVPEQILVFIEMLEEGGFTDQLLLLTHLLTGFTCWSQSDLHGAERRPHDLTVTEILHTHTHTHTHRFSKGVSFRWSVCSQVCQVWYHAVCEQVKWSESHTL